MKIKVVRNDPNLYRRGLSVPISFGESMSTRKEQTGTPKGETTKATA